MRGTHLAGLEGTNPLGFLAALGVQVAFANENEQPLLWWSENITPYAIVTKDFTIDRIVTQALNTFTYWAKNIALNPSREDGSKMPKGDELKLGSEDIRSYINQARKCARSGDLAMAMVSEGSLDKNKIAKPSDLYFMAGQQKFLKMARKILNNASGENIETGLLGPWNYNSNIPSLGWDIADDRVYALRANNPSSENKPSNPGVEALAILGLSMHPVFASRERTLTQGCSGSWKSGYYSWPIWVKPASLHVVKSLLAHAYNHSSSSSRSHWYRSWGISSILRSPIRRTDQGGYGTFGPPEIMWQSAQ